MATTPTVPTGYTLEEAEAQIATLTGLVDRLGEAIALADGPIPNVPAASGCVLYSAAGNLDYEGFDGNEYATGTLRLAILGSATIASTSPVIISAGGVSLSAPVLAAHYHFRSKLWFTANTTGTAGNAVFRVITPAFTNGSYSADYDWNGNASGIMRFDNTSGGGVNLTGPALTNGSAVIYMAEIEGDAVFTSAGTIAVQGLLSAAGTTNFVIASNSFMELSPIS